MIDVVKPLQLFVNHRVMEQGRRFYFIVSVTLGLRLPEGKALLEMDHLKEAFEAMGDAPLPDPGFPKPRGEFLVSGKCFAPSGKEVNAQQVTVAVGNLAKTLFIFGDRWWASRPGLGKQIEGHRPFREIEISYQNAFGGEGFARNPAGKGFAPVKQKDGTSPHLLPNVEDPRRLIGSAGDRPEPAGFGPLDPSWPQRARFQGTYDANYKYDFFPGYPADHDWHHFLQAPEDQWIDGFFRGDEPFSVTNMHPEMRVIDGRLPNLAPRAFILHTLNSSTPEFTELPLNLDTIWLMPEKLLALLIWRKGLEVGDDEASRISHLLAAYEHRADPPRGQSHYRAALDRRINSDDALLNNFNTQDLIPEGHKCAMEILQELAFAESGEKSALAANIEAKAGALRKEADEKVEEAVARAEKNMESAPLPEGFDAKKVLREKPAAVPDPDKEIMDRKIESALPGFLGGDPTKIQLKEFSFDKVDQIVDAIEEFAGKKEKQAKDKAKEELAKAKADMQERIAEMPPESAARAQEELKRLEAVDLDNPPPGPLPRVDKTEILAQVNTFSPQMVQAAQFLEGMRAAGIQDENSAELSRLAGQRMNDDNRELEQLLDRAQADFREGYILIAHHMKDGTSPHKQPLPEVAGRLTVLLARGGSPAHGDWACIDLAGQKLDGVDFSGAFLEQVNFEGASLRGVNLKGAILARARLAGADLSGADLSGANLGATLSAGAKFIGAKLNSAVLSNGDFTGADFTGADLTEAETLKVTVKGANFIEAKLPGLTVLDTQIEGANFTRADLSKSAFLNCSIKNCDFSQAQMLKVTFADTVMASVVFDGAELSRACFAATSPEKAVLSGVRFRGARLNQANFQGMDMKVADLRGAELENSNFMDADLSGADLSYAQAPKAMFRKTRLLGAKMDAINLMEGSLAKAYLVGASLAGANLYCVDFLRSTITNTDFSGANLDNTIIENWRPS